MHNESLARRQIHLSNDMRYKNQLNKKLKAWQQVHKRTITQRRSLMEQVKTWYEITKHKDGVYICGQTLPTCVIEIPSKLCCLRHFVNKLNLYRISDGGIKCCDASCDSPTGTDNKLLGNQITILYITKRFGLSDRIGQIKHNRKKEENVSK
jgi:hypothetical protein